MGLISQRIEDLLNGVSQSPPSRRSSSQAEEQINGLSSRTHGLMKRPGTKHLLKLSSSTPADAWNHIVNRSGTERYRMVFVNGDLMVTDAVTNLSVPVIFPHGKSYLGTATPSKDIRCVTSGDKTYVLNRSVSTAKGTAVAGTALSEALVVVKQGAPGKKYTVNMGTSFASLGPTIEVDNPAGTSLTELQHLATDYIANQIASDTAQTGFTLQQIGSTVYITRNDGKHFVIVANDGVNGEGLQIIQGSIQRFDELPLQAKDGIIVQVIGDPTTQFDNYYVQYSAANSAWKEVVQPGANTALDETTMPHVLTKTKAKTQTLYVQAVQPDLPVITYGSRNTYLTFNPDDTFPIGVTGTISPEAHSVSYTVAGQDQDCPTFVGHLYAALVAGNTAGSWGYQVFLDTPTTIRLRFVALSATGPTTTAAYTLAHPMARVQGIPDIPLVTNALVGSTLTDTTSGASGTIISNTPSYVTVSALAGGSRSNFLIGDAVNVVIPAGFVFDVETWDKRAAGDDVTCPYPSFVGKALDTITYTQDRLVLSAGESIVMSQASKPTNWFRQTATDLLADDVIDVSSAGHFGTFHSVFEWNAKLYYNTAAEHQVEVDGQPALSPQTLRFDPITSYRTAPGVPPVVAGAHVFLPRTRGAFTEILDYSQHPYKVRPEAISVTKDVPTYLEGAVVQMVADQAQGVLFVLTDAGNLYVYSYDYQNFDQTQLSWSRWMMPAGGKVLGIDLIDSTLGLVVRYPDGLYVETMNLDVDVADNASSVDAVSRMDRLVSLTGSYDGTHTTWTLPYAVAVNGSEGLVAVGDPTTGQPIPVTRPTATTVQATGYYAANPMYVGVLFKFYYELSTIYYRNEHQVADTRGRLNLKYLTVTCDGSTDFTVTVVPYGREAFNYTYNGDYPIDGELRIPVMCRNDEAVISLWDYTTGSCRFSTIMWEGSYFTRARQL